jgi:hypothetical protein
MGDVAVPVHRRHARSAAIRVTCQSPQLGQRYARTGWPRRPPPPPFGGCTASRLPCLPIAPSPSLCRVPAGAPPTGRGSSPRPPTPRASPPVPEGGLLLRGAHPLAGRDHLPLQALGPGSGRPGPCAGSRSAGPRSSPTRASRAACRSRLTPTVDGDHSISPRSTPSRPGSGLARHHPGDDVQVRQTPVPSQHWHSMLSLGGRGSSSSPRRSRGRRTRPCTGRTARSRRTSRSVRTGNRSPCRSRTSRSKDAVR